MLPGPGPLEERDAAMRLAAFDHVRRLTVRDGGLDSSTITAGFVYRGERVPLINPQRGFFKPRNLPFLLSIRTAIPRAGARLRRPDAAAPADLRRRLLEAKFRFNVPSAFSQAE